MLVSFGIKVNHYIATINKKQNSVHLFKPEGLITSDEWAGSLIGIAKRGQNTINVNTLKCTIIQIKIQIISFPKK